MNVIEKFLVPSSCISVLSYVWSMCYFKGGKSVNNFWEKYNAVSMSGVLERKIFFFFFF